MRQLIRKLGQLNTVIIITIFSVLLSVIITVVVSSLMQANKNIVTSISIAIIIPLIVAPLASWSLVRLVLKIDRLEKEMRNLATFDDLTGLLSRRAFFHGTRNYIAFSEREHMAFSVLAIDLDKFKNINDEFGHPAGDEVLRNFATITKTILRKSDLLGRIGGEEFAILLPNTSKDKASELSERLHLAIRESVVMYNYSSIKYTVSIGLVSFSPKETDSIENIIKQADQALYLAKENGRNRTVIFNANKTH